MTISTRIILFSLAATALCPTAQAQYTYFSQSSFTGGSYSTTNWTPVSSIEATSNIGLQNSTGTGGALLFKGTVPGTSTDYEVEETLTIAGGGNSYMIYLRATTSPASILQAGNQGTFDVAVISNVSGCTGSGATLNCSGTLYLEQWVAGTGTLSAQVPVNVANGSTFRAMVHGTEGAIYVNNVLILLFNPLAATTGTAPGIGLNGAYSNGIQSANIGQIDTVSPYVVNAQSVQTSDLPNQIDFHWTPVTDNLPNGIGLAYYDLYRNNVWFDRTAIPDFVDNAVTAGTSYTYAVHPMDYHLNATGTAFTVSTTPSSDLDPRQIGVHPGGTYWGGAGEQIDMRSGNLNFSQTLLKPMGRGGWSIPINLSYNSQNWRMGYSANAMSGQGTGPWNLGEDVGYGYGWTLQAGSLTLIYNGYFVTDHYVFTDASGAQYILNQNPNNSNVWSSLSPIYIWYDANARKLHFPDGSFWEFTCQSAGTEQDAGTAYPTLIEDSNGNEISITYANGVNTTWSNSSSRISTITDVRASGYPTYSFTYNTDAIPHLTGISNTIGTADTYSFTVTDGQTLYPPFTGYTTTSFGTTTVLQSLTQASTFTTAFTYEPSGTGTTGELTQVTYPYGGSLSWGYSQFNYASGQALREVTSRTLVMSPGGTAYQYSMSRPSTDNTLTTHSQACWTDSSGSAEKIWAFQTSGSASNAGLATSFSQGTPGTSACSLGYTNSTDTYTWSTDPAGRPFLSTVLSTLDPGQSFAVQKQTVIPETEVDAYGNTLEIQSWDYIAATASFGAANRTTTNTYLNNSNYTSAYIYNRLVSSTVTDGTNTATTASNSYDGSALTNVTGMTQHDSAYSTSLVYRGNPTTVGTPTSTVTQAFDIGGNITSTTNNGVTSTVTMNSAYSAPSSVSLSSSLTTNMTWSGFLGLTGVTDPNSDTTSVGYDAFARPASTTSPYGAVTSYTYNDTGSMPNHVATTNGHWVTNYLDGFGRTVKTNTGYGSGSGLTTLSTVTTTYYPCGCSPLGKVATVSQPYTPGGTQYNTVYKYDALGRPVSIAAPDATMTQSTTLYAYTGNQVKVTDPANNSKTYTMSAFGNLLTVQETDPTYGAVTTSYTYDVLNHLTGVSMPRGSTTQTRTFNYSVGTTVSGFLQSATNPETGTVKYTYNTNTTLASKTDNKGQKFTYAYDAYNRLTSISVNSTVLRTFIYDTNSLDNTGFSQNTVGRLAAVQYPANAQGIQFNDMYSYVTAGTSGAGLPAKKRLQVNQALNIHSGSYGTETLNLDATYTYNNEGSVASTTYPTTYAFNGGGVLTGTAGPAYTYTFDSAYRPSGLTGPGSSTVVSGVSYGPSNELLGITYNGITESRGYNALLQLTGVSSWITQAPVEQYVNMQYNYPAAPNNNGKACLATDAVTGEQVAYSYDSLNRLSSASAYTFSGTPSTSCAQTTGSTATWTQSYALDGFGNLTNKIGTGGGPNVPIGVNPTNNQITDGAPQYDANGNLTAQTGVSYTYDAENRMTYFSSVSNGNRTFGYDSQNKRIMNWTGSTDQNGNASGYTVYYYGVKGERLGVYNFTVGYWAGGTTPTLENSTTSTETFFGARRLAPLDRLGSARSVNSTASSYYPFGEDKSTNPAIDAWKFGTYWSDSASGLDYAVNRYYSSSLGRFLTPDPSPTSAAPGSPISWNQYTYVSADPSDLNDLNGLEEGPPAGADQACSTDANGNVLCTSASGLPYYDVGATFSATGTVSSEDDAIDQTIINLEFPGTVNVFNGTTFQATIALPPSIPPANRQYCGSLAQKIANLYQTLRNKAWDLENNPNGLPVEAPGSNANSQWGHVATYASYQEALQKALKKWNNYCGGGPPPAVPATAPTEAPGTFNIPSWLLYGVGSTGAAVLICTLVPEACLVGGILAPVFP